MRLDSIISQLVRVKNSSGREDWKYLPVTEKQVKTLKKMGITDIPDIDRGGACALITYLINEKNDAWAHGFTQDNGLEE